MKAADKGFLAGYFTKLAIEGGSNETTTGDIPPAGKEPAPTQAPEGQGAPATRPPTPVDPKAYDKLLEMLKGLGTGAAAGAVSVGGITALAGRKKPGNLRRTITMALAAGVPAGVIAQLFATGVPGGTGAGGISGISEAGRVVGGAGRKAWDDISSGRTWKGLKGFGSGGVKGMNAALAAPTT